MLEKMIDHYLVVGILSMLLILIIISDTSLEFNAETFLSSFANDTLEYFNNLNSTDKPHISDLLDSAPGLIHTSRSSFLDHKILTSIKNSKETTILNKIHEEEQEEAAKIDIIEDYIKGVECKTFDTNDSSEFQDSRPIATSLSFNDIKIWTGTWNMGAKVLL